MITGLILRLSVAFRLAGVRGANWACRRSSSWPSDTWRPKNYVRLIQAVATLRDRGQPISLVIVGNDGGQAKGVVEEINRLSLSDVVRLLSGVTDGELADLYSLCTMVAFPSRYEGFGIPVLEAMAAQRPIVLSDIPVFRELTEDKGVYFPPDDSEAMAGVIADLLSCRERQEKLVSYGRGARSRLYLSPTGGPGGASLSASRVSVMTTAATSGT